MAMQSLFVRLALKSREFERGIDKANRNMVTLKQRTQNVSSAFSALRRHCLAFVAATAGIALVARSFLSAARTAENYQVRLKVLLGNVEKGNQLFKDMAKFASGVSFQYQEIMGAATNLAGVMRGGGKEIGKWMPLIADLAAATGLTIQDTTSQVIRMYSAGAAAADMFRERGVLAMLGFQANVKYTAEETRKIMFESWQKAGSQFKDASKELAKTWDGLMGMIADKWFQLRTKIMDAGVYDELKKALEGVNKAFERWIENNDKLIQQKTAEYIEKVKTAIEGITKVYDALPAAAISSGLIMAILFKSSAQIAIFVGALTYVATHLDDLKWSIDALGKVTGLKPLLGPWIDLFVKAGKELKWLIDDFNAIGEPARTPMETLEARLKALKDKYADLNLQLELSVKYAKAISPQLLGQIDTIEKQIAALERYIAAVRASTRAIDEEIKDTKTILDKIEGLDKAAVETIAYYWTRAFKEINKGRKEDLARTEIATRKLAAAWTGAFEEIEQRKEALIASTEEWQDAIKTVAERAAEARMEVVKLWELGLINTKELDRILAFISEKYKKTFDEIENYSDQFVDALRSNWSNLFYDVLRGELDNFEDYFSAFCNTLLETFADMLAQQLALWIKQQAAMKASTAVVGIGTAPTGAPIAGIGAAGGPWGMAAMAAVVMTYGIMQKRAKKQREENQRLGEQLKQLTISWAAVREEVIAMNYATSDLEEGTRRINKQFDDYAATLKALNAPLQRIIWLEGERIKALINLRERLIQEFAAPLEDMIARLQLSGIEYELYKLDNWYKDQIENARSLGLESVKLLREAYELSKKELVLKEQQALTGSLEDLLNMVATIGMTAIEAQIHTIGQANADLLASWQPAMDQIAGLPHALKDYQDQIWSLQNVFAHAVVSYRTAEAEWGDAQHAMIVTLQGLDWPYKQLIKNLRAQGITDWNEIIEHLAPYIAGWSVEPYVGIAEEYYAAQIAFQQAATEFLPLIETIPGEIADLVAAMGDYETAVDSLAGTMDEATAAAITAYAAQMDALRSEFLGGLEDIIRSHTLSEYEQQVYELNKWYKEQKINAEALGFSLDVLNLAYAYQLQALQEANMALDESGASLDDWTSALKSLQDQILDIETSLANPIDILERMAILEAEIAGQLGPDWLAGIFDMTDLTPAGVSGLQDLLSDYLGMATDAFQRPSIEYQELYSSILAALGSLEAEAEAVISEYDILQAQLNTQLNIETILQDIADGIPSLQLGIGYVPETGIYKLHEGESVSPPGMGDIVLNLVINESRTPHETGRVVTQEVESFIRSARGRKMVQQVGMGR